MRMRPTEDGSELRLLRVMYDKHRKLEGKAPKREVTLGHISAACGPDEIDVHLRLLSGHSLRPKERAQLVERLKGNRSADEGNARSIIERVRVALDNMHRAIGGAAQRGLAACGFQARRSSTEEQTPASGGTREERARDAEPAELPRGAMTKLRSLLRPLGTVSQRCVQAAASALERLRRLLRRG